MTNATDQAREDQFLGALLGLAIGDAMGRSLSGLAPNEIAGRLEEPLRYGPPSEEPVATGEITDRTEIALCLVESLTTNQGRPDPDNMVARMGFLAAGPSRQFMTPGTIDGIALATEHDGQVDESHQPPPELSVAVRGIPVGLLHAVGGFDSSLLRRDAETVTKLSHAGQVQADLTTAVAMAVAEAGRTRTIVADIERPAGGGGTALGFIFEAVRQAETFVSGLKPILIGSGDLLSAGAIGGALLGTRFGASGIPQTLIDDLDARIYLSLAAPWFYRTAVMRAGTVIDLRRVR
jgi:ADP-ribosylglycohydrolase